MRAQTLKILVPSLLLLLTLGFETQAFANGALDAWKPAFDPSGAEYTYLVSNVTHPAPAGVGVGYKIRDRVWEESHGRLYVDFRPLSQLGGEKDVINKLKIGAIQGMLCSSVLAANVSDKLGLVNLPFLVDTFDKLEQFRNTPEIWNEYRDSAMRSGLMVLDITGYGTYGWATKEPVDQLVLAKKINFRIAQAPVNTDLYKSWGLKFTVLPWPDVPQALQTGVITGLDHTPIICNMTKKFTVARHFTQVDYAQGLFVHFVNRRWFNKLPQDLQEILTRVVVEESRKARQATREQQAEQIADAKQAGVTFHQLNDSDREQMVAMSEPVYKKWEDKIGPDYLKKVRDILSQ